MAKNDVFIIFETRIMNETARVEVPADEKVLTSREARKGYENTARMSFRNLSPKFIFNQPIKAVDVVVMPKLDEPDPGEGPGH